MWLRAVYKSFSKSIPTGSGIHAVDLGANAVKKIPKEYNGVSIKTSIMDFSCQTLPFHQLDGILMANSLHYVRDKEAFLKQMMAVMKEGGCFLLVEYDMGSANQWVPYPLPVAAAEELFLKCKVSSVELLNKRKSVFGERVKYAMLTRK